MEDLTLTIQGMNCGHCVRSITEVLNTLKGVQVDEVKIGEATLGYDPQRITPEHIIHAIAEAGYTARLSTEAA
jgi:copper chaperone